MKVPPDPAIAQARIVTAVNGVARRSATPVAVSAAPTTAWPRRPTRRVSAWLVSPVTTEPIAIAVPCIPRDPARDPLLGSDQRDGRGEGVQEPAPGDERGVEAQREAVSDEAVDPRWCWGGVGAHESRSTMWSTHAVRAWTSAGSTAGNIATLIWLRPSLR